MPESCPGCGRTVPEGASFCPWCGVARGSRGLTLWQYYKSLISRIAPVKPGEVGDLHRSETDLRVKLSTVSWWRTWSQFVNALIKGLPTVIIANTILLIVTIRTISVTDPNYRSLVMTPEATLAVFAVLFIISLWATRRIDVRLTTFGRQAQFQEAEVKALRNTAIKKFTEYKQQMMPTVRPDQLRSDFVQQDGKLNRKLLIRNWRDKALVSYERQVDMDDIDHNLLVRMDGLVTLATEFADEFDNFGEKCCVALMQVEQDRNKALAPGTTPSPLSYPIAIQALYRYFSKDVQNENDIQWAQEQMQLIDSQGGNFLRKFFRGSPSDPGDFASLNTRADLFELADKTKKAHETALKQSEKVEIELEAKAFLQF